MSDAFEDAFTASTNASDQERSKVVVEILGPRIAAAAVGLSDAQELVSWAQGEGQPAAEDAERLRVLMRIVVAVESVFGANTAAGFVRGANPGLDDDSIVQVLATNSPTEVESRLVGVTRDFLAG